MGGVNAQGMRLPKLGLGTWTLKGEACTAAVLGALDRGEARGDGGAGGAEMAARPGRGGGDPEGGGSESQQANHDAPKLRLDDADRAAIAALPKDVRCVSPAWAPAWDVG